MLKFLCLTATVFLIALIGGCSSATKRSQVISTSQPTSTEAAASLQSDEIKTKKAEQQSALIKELEAVELALNAANETALRQYQNTEIQVKEEQIAKFYTDPLAEQRAALKSAENKQAYLSKKLQNGEEATQKYRQILNQPEYQQVLQDMGLSPEIVFNEPVENILIRVQSKARI